MFDFPPIISNFDAAEARVGQLNVIYYDIIQAL